MREQPWPGLSLSGQPPVGAPLVSAVSLQLLAGPSSQVEVDVPEGGVQGGPVELAVVEDPAPDDRVEHPRQIGELLVGPPVQPLQAAINRYIDEHNNDPAPFVWTKTADQITAKLNRLNASVH